MSCINYRSQSAESQAKSAEIGFNRLKVLIREAISLIVDRIPESRMSLLTREFTIQLIDANKTRLLGS